MTHAVDTGGRGYRLAGVNLRSTATRCSFALAVLLFAASSLLAGEPAAKEKIPLHVLYVGHPGGERAKDFVDSLKQHFTEVETGNLAGFQITQKLKADVVLLDYDGDGFKAPSVNFPEGYSKPTLTIGVAGGLICSRNALKTGYL